MLSPEQISNIKKQIFQQIDSTFPEDKKEAAKKEIDSMNPEELEEFMEMNSKAGKQQQKCIFCSIVFGDIESYKIAENPEAVAVLEINPISKGHVLIIPKKHISSKKELSPKVLELVDNVSERIKKNFSPIKISLEEKEMFGHFLIDLIPEYENEKRGEKKQAKKEELMELLKFFQEKPKKEKVSKPKTKKIKEKIWLPQRIP